MVTLKELLELTWNCTLLDVSMRTEEGRLLMQYIIGEGQSEENATIGQWNDIKQGMLTMIDKSINMHGRNVRGTSEIGWGTDFKAIPPELLKAEVTHFSQRPRPQGKGSQIRADLKESGQLSLL